MSRTGRYAVTNAVNDLEDGEAWPEEGLAHRELDMVELRLEPPRAAKRTFMQSWYWDFNDQTRTFAKRFFARRQRNDGLFEPTRPSQLPRIDRQLSRSRRSNVLTSSRNRWPKLRFVPAEARTIQAVRGGGGAAAVAAFALDEGQSCRRLNGLPQRPKAFQRRRWQLVDEQSRP